MTLEIGSKGIAGFWISYSFDRLIQGEAGPWWHLIDGSFMLVSTCTYRSGYIGMVPRLGSKLKLSKQARDVDWGHCKHRYLHIAKEEY